MRFLIDNALSPIVARQLKKSGLDAQHVRDIQLHNASDHVIFRYAYSNDRIIITADTDFGFILSRWKKNKPSVIIFRKGSEREPVRQTNLLINNLDNLKEPLTKGSIVIIEPYRIRIKSIPFHI
ncbi:MAG: DUF5615 family PIN-like protein [Bacteroidetes bacterium]|nr:DUF5615 family PIN-like protein [Bacteroidota bacterium]